MRWKQYIQHWPLTLSRFWHLPWNWISEQIYKEVTSRFPSLRGSAGTFVQVPALPSGAGPGAGTGAGAGLAMAAPDATAARRPRVKAEIMVFIV